MKITNLTDLIKLHEGFSSTPYKCSAGKWTIGYGHNIEANPIPGKSLECLHKHGLTDAEAEELLIKDIGAVMDEIKANQKLSTIAALSLNTPARRAVLYDMAFNMGVPTLLTFKKMLSAILAQDWDDAALEMMHSKWYRQVGSRGLRLVKMMETGEWPTE